MDKELSYVITKREELRNQYMPFVLDGGLFIPRTGNNGNFILHQQITLHLTLPEPLGEFTCEAKVIWITPEKISDSSKKPGIGLQFIGEDGEKLKSIILSNMEKLEDRNSETM